jgi:hypothetical protein
MQTGKDNNVAKQKKPHDSTTGRSLASGDIGLIEAVRAEADRTIAAAPSEEEVLEQITTYY